MELRIHVGRPPVIVVRGKEHWVDGPALTADNAEQLLRSISNSRQIREWRESGAAEFGYKFRNSSRFLIRVVMDDGNLGFDVLR